MSLTLQYQKIKRHALRSFKGPGALTTEADHREVLCHQETEDLAPVLFLPGQIEKVTGAPVESSKEIEIELVTGRTAIHAPTIAYHFHNAALIDGSIYVGNLRHYISPARSQTKVKRLNVGALASSFCGSKYFGHWLKDDCTARFLAEEIGYPICITKLPYPDMLKYSGMFSQDWSDVTDAATIDHLVIFQDHSQNSLKRKRYEALRSRVKSQIGGPGTSSLVYLKRGKTGAARLIQNEQEVEDALEKVGFTKVEVGVDDVEMILKALSTAKIVISMEGSHCGHCVMSMPKYSGLIVLEPPNRFGGNQRGWADCLSIRLGLVVGDQTNFGTRFSVTDILKTVDLMMKVVGS